MSVPVARSEHDDGGIPYFWPVLSFIYVSLSLLFSFNGLFGNWAISLFGVTYPVNWDPDGFYIGAGITFSESRYAGFVGHPGIPLIFCIHAISRLMHIASFFSGPAVDFAAFAAKNIFWIILAVKLFITCCYLASFYAVYSVARFYLTKTSSQIAIAAYATTGIVLYYFNKISPEPLLVFFVFFSLWAMFRYVGTHRASGVSYAYLILSASAAALALLTKIAIALPLPVFILGYILSHRMIAAGDKAKGAALFLVSFLTVLFLAGQKVDWTYFFNYWFNYAPGTPSYAVGRGVAANIVSAFMAAYENIFQFVLDLFVWEAWLPGRSSFRGHFNAAALPYLVCSVVGLAMYWKQNPDMRRRVLAILVLCIALAPLVMYRAAHHYYVIHLAVASFFAGYCVSSLAGRVSSSRARTAAVALVSVLLVNSLSAAIFLRAKYADMREYARWWKPYFTALNEMRRKDRIAIVAVSDMTDIPGRIVSYYVDQRSPLCRAFERQFLLFDEIPPDAVIMNERIITVLRHTPDGVIKER